MEKTPTPEQQAIIDFVRGGQGNLVAEALAGTGKCLGKGTPVLLFDGSVMSVEDIQVGMLLMGPDSRPRLVLSTNVGSGPLYRIEPTKGEPWVCNDVHMMTLIGTNYWHGQIRDVMLAEHLTACSAAGQRPDRNWKLLRTGVDFPASSVSLDPYLAGLWLGDGTFDKAEITNADPEVVAFCRRIAPSIGVECIVVPTERNHSNTIRFRIGARGTINTRTETNKFWEEIQAFKVDGQKRIPRRYLVNGRGTRLALLAGLLDTDGYLSNGYFEITTKYEGLSDDILFLARSLGFAAYHSKKRATIKTLGFEGVYNRITIAGGLDEIPCLVPRRQASERKQIKRVNVTGWTAEPIGVGEYYGFTLDGDGRFLLGDFTVTHNTSTLVMALPGIPQRSVLLCAFNKRIATELEAKIPKMPRTHAVAVRTFHAQGLSILKAHYPRIRVDASATEALVNRVAGQAISFKIRRAAIRLLRTMKETMFKPNAPTAAETLALGHEYNLFDKGIEERQIDLAVEVARDAYLVSLDLKNIEVIDFCDMVWAPIALNLEPKSRYKAVIVDELQDISEPQFEMLMRLMAPDGRFIGIGDRWQQIYDWRGSMGEKAWMIARDKLKAKFLPLTMTFRCSHAVVNEARQLVSGLRALPDAAQGLVQKCTWAALPRAINPRPVDAVETGTPPEGNWFHTFVLSRNNADLLDCALYLWREKTQFQLNAGIEMLDPLFQLLDYKLDLRSTDLFLKSLSEWRKTELAKAEKLNAAAWADRIEEQFLMLVRASGHAAPTGIKRLLNQIVQPNNSGVLLSTVHKVKGLEADRVFLLRQTFGRHDERDCLTCGGAGTDDGDRRCYRCDGSGKFSKEASQEELNIEYVAITRAKNKLVWVDIRREDKPDRRANLDPAVQRVLDFHIISDDSQMASRSLEGLTGTRIKSVAEQLVDAGERFPAGIPRDVSIARLTTRGEHARDLVESAYEDDDPTGGEDEGDPTGDGRW